MREGTVACCDARPWFTNGWQTKSHTRPQLIWRVPAGLWMPQIYCACFPRCQCNLALICPRAQDLPQVYTGFCTYDLMRWPNEMWVTGGEGVNTFSWSENAPRVVEKYTGWKGQGRKSQIGHLYWTLQPQDANPCYLLLCFTKLLILGLRLLVCNPVILVEQVRCGLHAPPVWEIKWWFSQVHVKAPVLTGAWTRD